MMLVLALAKLSHLFFWMLNDLIGTGLSSLGLYVTNQWVSSIQFFFDKNGILLRTNYSIQLEGAFGVVK